ncbi:MAG: hypothetical protein KTR15_05065 [Phycisphaeraceae bacterium]|nr:hypothetical protein [Phycisphaeraceae bacterium]
MKNRALAALSLLVILTLGLSIAHAEDPKTRGKAGDTLTPLAMGNTWVYASDGEDLVTTDRIEGVVLFDGQPWHLLRSYEREKGQPVEANESLEMDLWLAHIDGHECDAFIEPADSEEESTGLKLGAVSTYYRYPATAGETYKPSKDDAVTVMTVVALNEKVKTKAGEFDCVVYKETSTEEPDFSFTSYVAPGIGIVKQITTDAEGTYTAELISYTLVED